VNDEKLERRLAALRRTVAPSPGLWRRIEERLDETDRAAEGASGGARTHRRLGAPAWAGLAAAACLAAAAAVVVPRALAPVDAGAADLATLRRELRDAEREYAAARARLVASLRAVAGVTGEETVARIESDLRSVDGMVADLREAADAGADDGDWQTMFRVVKLYRSQTAGVARADDLVRRVSYREESE
jgi:hypothetical protein